MLHVQGLRRNCKNLVKQYSPVQVKVREATSNDPWGPPAGLLAEICRLCLRDPSARTETMQLLWKRLSDHGKNWRHVYKALVLMEYLVRAGPQQVCDECRENIYAIETLRDFQHRDETGRDQGKGVRERARALAMLLRDPQRLAQHRSNSILPTSPTEHHETTISPSASVPLSDLERCRPQTLGEEELQLRLALAVSRQEAREAEAAVNTNGQQEQEQLASPPSQQQTNYSGKPPAEQPPPPPPMSTSSSALDDLAGLSLQEWTDQVCLNMVNDPFEIKDVPWNNSNSVMSDPWSPMSADLSSEEGSTSAASSVTHNLDKLLSPESPLVQLDSNPNRWTQGNPFQAARPPPKSMNELMREKRL